MTLERRVTKLENAGLSGENPVDVIFLCGMQHDGTSETGGAFVFNVPGGNLSRQEGETAEQFRRRVYAVNAAGKPVENMTEAEFADVKAQADERIGREGRE